VDIPAAGTIAESIGRRSYRSCRSSGVAESGELSIEIVDTTHFLEMLQLYWYLASMTKPAKTFKDLIVWQKAHRFVLAIYSLTETFPKSEIYCLTSQMRRAAISIPANIAEGFRKRGESDKTRFLNVAQGPLEESRYYLILIQDLGYGTTIEIEPLLEEVSKLLVAYARAIESNRTPS
jgi:four helix bundle protein